MGSDPIKFLLNLYHEWFAGILPVDYLNHGVVDVIFSMNKTEQRRISIWTVVIVEVEVHTMMDSGLYTM